jgi:ABC-type transporter Mla MlaB component
MAFSLFHKPPAGKDKASDARPKPELTPQHDARRPAAPATVSARELADSAKARARAAPKQPVPQTAEERDRDITLTGPPSFVDWTQGSAPSIQVAEANPGLCAVLENAALLFASGQPQQARQLLEQGVASDEDARLSPLAWLALFDLLQRSGDRASFDQLALQYVVAFERSAPGWEERGAKERSAKERGTKPEAEKRSASGGYFALTGKLSEANAAQINNMLAAAQKQQQIRLDLGSLTGADDLGTRLLADALGKLRKQQCVLALQHPEKIRQALEHACCKGREAGEGYWTLLLELLQWQNERVVFEDRAVDFAVAFELSPPSWEPPRKAAAPPPVAEADPLPVISEIQDALVWQGTMLGPNDQQLAKFAEFRDGHNIIPIDMTAVERIDFVCAGALLNAIGRAEGQRKTVQIAGATPIIRALLLLIGISPRHFVKKAQ